MRDVESVRDAATGIGLVLGAALGGIVLAFTGSMMWVILGAGFGLVVGSAFTRRRADQEDDTRQNG